MTGAAGKCYKIPNAFFLSGSSAHIGTGPVLVSGDSRARPRRSGLAARAGATAVRGEGVERLRGSPALPSRGISGPRGRAELGRRSEGPVGCRPRGGCGRPRACANAPVRVRGRAQGPGEHEQPPPQSRPPCGLHLRPDLRTRTSCRVHVRPSPRGGQTRATCGVTCRRRGASQGGGGGPLPAGTPSGDEVTRGCGVGAGRRAGREGWGRGGALRGSTHRPLPVPGGAARLSALCSRWEEKEWVFRAADRIINLGEAKSLAWGGHSAPHEPLHLEEKSRLDPDVT